MHENKDTHPVRMALIALYIIFVLYLLYMNLTPFGGMMHYEIDVGQDSDMKKSSAYLAGPLERVSEPASEGQANYRNLTHGLVYFYVPAGKAYNESDIDVTVRYRMNGENMKMLLGLKDREDWHYTYATINDPLCKYAENYNYLGECSGTHIYSLQNHMHECSDFMGFISDEIVLEKNIDKTPALAKHVDSDKNSTFFNYSIRGDHTMYVYINNAINLRIQKYDQNWYEGEDLLNIRIYGPDGLLFANETIEDDGISNRAPEVHPLQEKGYYFTAPRGTYKIVLDDLSNGSDVITKNIQISSGKLVFENRVFVLDPAEFYANAVFSSQISFVTYHDVALQDILVDSKTVSVKNRTEKYIEHLNEGAHTIKIPKGDIIMSSDNYISPTKEAYFEPYNPVMRDYDAYMDVAGKGGVAARVPQFILVAEQYSPPKKDGDWFISTVHINPEEAYIKNSQLGFMFNIPNIGNNTVSIDWIKTKITVPPIWRR